MMYQRPKLDQGLWCVRTFWGTRKGAVALGCFLWLVYATLEFRHLYNTAISVPPTQRVVRNVEELWLPHLYFCPADRGRIKGFQWYSYECLLTYKDDRKSCPAWLQYYGGRTPESFKNGGNFTGESCLEFGTHMIGVRKEWSAAWNEITLRAAFSASTDVDLSNNLQEVELGYLPVEWDVGTRESSAQRYYYPLLRVPIFHITPPGRPQGVATRSFIAKEEDRGILRAGRYWYTYGTMQISVLNASLPVQSFEGAAYIPSGRVGVVHVVLTLEDFKEFDFQVVSCFFPLLRVIGEVAGVAALLAWFLTVPWALRKSNRHETRDGNSNAACFATSAASDVAKHEYREAGDSEEEEGAALLGSTDATELIFGEESTSSRPLLRIEATDADPL